MFFMYISPVSGVPPARELVSFRGAEAFGRGEPGAIGGVVADVEDGKNGSLKGWFCPGFEEEIAAGGVLGEIVEGGGVAGAALFVCGTVATFR